MRRETVLGCMLLLMLQTASARAAAPNASSDLIARAQRATEMVVSKYQADSPGAAFLIAHRGKVLMSGGVGLADLEAKVPLTDESLLRLGSISKPITAVAVVQLAQQGRLDLDEPISTYAPELPEIMGAVNLRQLLSHRSGLPDHAFDPALVPLVWQPMTTQEIIDFQDGKPRDFAPGERYDYVNFNYVLIAHVVEKVAGKSFIEFANNEIFAANGLDQSRYDEPAAIIPGRARFYERREGQVRNAAAIDLSHVSAAGALLSSVRDLSRWMHLLVAGELIGPDALREAWSPVPLPDQSETRYGLGFNVTQAFGETLIWHTGLTPGAQGAFSYARESGIFIIVLSNVFYWPADTGELVDEMMAIMLQPHPKAKR